MIKRRELTVTRIGNSRGVRLPADVLRRYQITNSVILEQRQDEIALRPKLPSAKQKLSWKDTAKAMAAANEDWSAWDLALADGLDED